MAYTRQVDNEIYTLFPPPYRAINIDAIQRYNKNLVKNINEDAMKAYRDEEALFYSNLENSNMYKIQFLLLWNNV